MKKRKPTLDLWKFAIQYRLDELEQYCRTAEIVQTEISQILTDPQKGVGHLLNSGVPLSLVNQIVRDSLIVLRENQARLYTDKANLTSTIHSLYSEKTCQASTIESLSSSYNDLSTTVESLRSTQTQQLTIIESLLRNQESHMAHIQRFLAAEGLTSPPIPYQTWSRWG